jgi:hypothetical protein
MVHWYWVPIAMVISGVTVFGVCRFFDSKLDAIFNKLQDLTK